MLAEIKVEKETMLAEIKAEKETMLSEIEAERKTLEDDRQSSSGWGAGSHEEP